MKELIVGIDLGTTNSELAVVLEDKLQVIPIHGNPIMPSCVGLDLSGKLLVGQAAKNQLVAAPESTILSIKRKMGEDTKVTLGDKQFSPEEISAFILRELVQEAERQLGRPIKKAVITVPAFFNERQRKATQMAGELAGLEVLRILNEPTAAALAYGMGAQASGSETMLVYDLGGGTFDVSVVTVESGVVEVKASHGDTHLGGDDFDQLLVDLAVLEFKKCHNVDLLPEAKILRRLKVAMERAKCRLSDEPFSNVREEYMDGQHHLELEVARHDYERLIKPLLEKTLTCLHQSLTDAKLGPKDINKIMLVGGATRTPLVRYLLQEHLHLEPRSEINPDLIVAMGAAIQAGVLAGEKRHSILVDITPHTFSTAAIGIHDGYRDLICIPLIPRNTPLPVSKSELFSTCYDNETEIKVTAYQGEGVLPEENTLIGDFLVEGLSKVPMGNQVVINFALDLNGMLQVTATEKATGLARTVTMDTRGAHTLDLDEARRNIASLVGESQPDEGPDALTLADESGAAPADPQTLIASAKDLRKRAEALLQKNINAEDVAEIRQLIRQSAEAIGAGDTAALARLNEALADLLFYLED
jgi:molecular chaperone DnaK